MSTTDSILPSRILSRILVGTEIRVIPLQFLHFYKSLFFGSFIICQYFHSVNKFSSFQIFPSRMYSMSTDTFMSALIDSAGIPPETAAFPFLSRLIALFFSDFIGLLALMFFWCNNWLVCWHCSI